MKVVVTLVVLMVASFGITATTGVPTQQCQDTYNQECSSGQASQQVDKMKCCSKITMLFSMDATCICDIFAAQGLSTEASIISFLNTTCNFKYNGRLPCGGAPVPPSVSPSAGSVGSPPAPPSQSPSSALPPRPSASSPSAAGSVESPPAPPSEGPNSAAPPSKGQTSGHSPKTYFPPESPSPLSERNPKAALPPSEGWRPRTFFNSFGLTAMYLFCIFIVA